MKVSLEGPIKGVVYVVCALLLSALIYFGYLAGKTISYTIFYKDMVEQTIKEMVKSDALR